MKKFLIYLSTFLFLFGVSVAFASIWTEDFEDGDFEPWVVGSGDYVISNGELHMLNGFDYGAFIGANIHLQLSNELIHYFSADIRAPAITNEFVGLNHQWYQQDGTGLQIYYNMHRPSQWLYAELFYIEVGAGATFIAREDLETIDPNVMNTLSIKLNDTSVTVGLNGIERDIFKGIYYYPETISNSGASVHAHDVASESDINFYVDNLVAHTSNPAKFDYVLLGSEVRQFDPSRYSFDKSSIWYKGNPYWFMITFAGTSGDPPVYPVFLDAPIYSDSSITDPYGLVNNPNYVTNTNFSSAGFFDSLGFAPPGQLWEDKNYTFFIDANDSMELDPDEVTRDWYIPSNSLKEMSIPQNINISEGIHPTITWNPVPDADKYMVNFYSLLPSGMVDLSVRLHTSGQITETTYTYPGDLFRDGKEYAIWVQARESHPIYGGLFFNRSGYFTKHRAINKLDLFGPGWIIISDAVGILWALNVETQETYKYHQFDESFWYGNFDIQYITPTKLLIANYGSSRIEEFDLKTKELRIITDPLLINPIGVCVSARGYYYIADHAGFVSSYDLKTGTFEILADSGPNGEAFIQPDGIVEDKKGRVIMTDHAGRIYRITPRNKFIEILAEIPGHNLNGVVLTKKGQLIVASSLPAAIFKVDPDTGEYLTLYEGYPLRNPEDIAIDSNGNIHILDSDFMHLYEDFLPGIYVLEKGNSQLNTLYTGDPFLDVVDILITPFRGF